MDLHLLITKSALFHREMTNRPIFKITGDFSENACFENPNKTSEFMKFRRFDVFLIRYVTKSTYKSKFD